MHNMETNEKSEASLILKALGTLGVFAVVALVVLALFTSCAPNRARHLEHAPNAKQLARVMAIEYRQNSVRFGQEHVGTQYRIHGKIDRINATGSVVFSKGEFGTGKTLVCHFVDPLELVNLSVGDKIVATGMIAYVKDPYRYEKLHMKDCRLDQKVSK